MIKLKIRLQNIDAETLHAFGYARITPGNVARLLKIDSRQQAFALIKEYRAYCDIANYDIENSRDFWFWLSWRAYK